ncbi:hypothetical protein GGU11DRAFT_767719 [Lentinula aff. detonsa]|nr:hypothetical protein GGU11DRAFT_767719 [Lentinula aff. detonsa]
MSRNVVVAITWLVFFNVVAAVMTSDAIPFSEYRLLFGLCRDEGPGAHIAVRYRGYAYAILHYDECHPIEVQEQAILAEVGVFCRAAVCYEAPQTLSVSENSDTVLRASHVAPFKFGPGEIVTSNGTDFARILGESAMCFSPSLSSS